MWREYVLAHADLQLQQILSLFNPLNHRCNLHYGALEGDPEKKQ